MKLTYYICTLTNEGRPAIYTYTLPHLRGRRQKREAYKFKLRTQRAIVEYKFTPGEYAYDQNQHGRNG